MYKVSRNGQKCTQIKHVYILSINKNPFDHLRTECEFQNSL